MRKFSWFLVGLIYCLMVWGQSLFPQIQSLPFAQTYPWIGLLLWSGAIFFASTFTEPAHSPTPASPKVKRLALAGLMGLLIQYALGALSRNYQAALICPNFPSCQDGFLPQPFDLQSGITFFHRWWGVLMLGLFFHLAIVIVTKMPELLRPARHALGLAVAQIFLGVSLVMSQLRPDSRLMHVTVGYALWGFLFFIAIRAGDLKRFKKMNTNP